MGKFIVKNPLTYKQDFMYILEKTMLYLQSSAQYVASLCLLVGCFSCCFGLNMHLLHLYNSTQR